MLLPVLCAPLRTPPALRGLLAALAVAAPLLLAWPLALHGQHPAAFAGWWSQELAELKMAARRRGEDIIDFGMGNPDGPTPPHIVQKLVETVQRLDTHGYSVSKGIPRLRRAICSRPRWPRPRRRSRHSRLRPSRCARAGWPA